MIIHHNIINYAFLNWKKRLILYIKNNSEHIENI